MVRALEVLMISMADAVRALEVGQELHGYTDGRVDVLDLVDALCTRAGEPCSLVVSTSALSMPYAARMRGWLDSGRLTELVVIASDRMAKMNDRTGKDQFCDEVVTVLGSCLRWAIMHAKTATAVGPRVACTLVTSGNMNRNPRCESVFVSVDPAVAAHVAGVMRAVVAGPSEVGRHNTYYTHALADLFGDGLESEPSLDDELARWHA